MASSLAQKLKIKENHKLLVINAPADFETVLQPLPDGVTISTKGKAFNQLHWFVLNKEQLNRDLNKIVPLVQGDVLCWTYYPKGTSKLQTDLTRDKGREELLRHEEYQWISLISFNDTWSAFGFRIKTKEQAVPRQGEIFAYIDAAKKEVRVPEDLAEVFAEHKTEAALFNKLSFSCRKEYVEWIITAKKEDTRKKRLAGTLERLAKGWKNPTNT